MTNALYCGDNLPLLREKLPDGCANLIYLDPPFASQREYPIFKEGEIRGAATNGGEIQNPKSKIQNQAAFSDVWKWRQSEWEAVRDELPDNDLRRVVTALIETRRDALTAYLVMMTPRLVELRRVLAPDGSLYLHCDAAASHYLKIILDALFGPESFRREIVWRSGWVSGFKTRARNWVRNHDVLLYYVRDPQRYTFHVRERVRPYPPGYARRGEPGKAGGIALDDVWDEPELYSPWIKSFSTEKCGWATQKPLALLDRIVRVSSNPSELVLDPFCGSGTTLLAAHALDRNWIGIDAAPAAIAVAQSRLANTCNLHAPDDYASL